MRAHAWSTIILVLAAPLVHADEVDVHVGADEASESCTGYRQEETYEYSWRDGVNEGHDEVSWGSYDESCSWSESDLAASVAKDDEEVAAADVGERSEGTRQGDFVESERHQTLCDGAPCDVRTTYVYAQGTESRTSRTGAHARLLGEEASLDRSRCHSDTWSSRNAWGGGSYNVSESTSSCEGGLFLRAGDHAQDLTLYRCDAEGRTAEYQGGTWESQARTCAVTLAPPAARVEGTGTLADGTGAAPAARYEDSVVSNCFASGEEEWCEGGGESAGLVLTVALDIGPSWSYAVSHVVPLPRLAALP